MPWSAAWAGGAVKAGRLLALAASHGTFNVLLAQTDPSAAFERFARLHGKPYFADAAEYNRRQAIFQVRCSRYARRSSQHRMPQHPLLLQLASVNHQRTWLPLTAAPATAAVGACYGWPHAPAAGAVWRCDGSRRLTTKTALQSRPVPAACRKIWPRLRLITRKRGPPSSSA